MKSPRRGAFQTVKNLPGYKWKDTIDWGRNTPDTLFRRFLPFRLGLRQPRPKSAASARICRPASLRLKNQKSLENTSLSGAEQFCRSRNVSRQEKTRREYLPYCRLTQYGRPVKTVSALVNRWYVKKPSGFPSRSITRCSDQNRKIKYCFLFCDLLRSKSPFDF